MEASRATTRDEIARAAAELFARQGYAATGIEQIREHSGASIGSIYHHFGGKEQIAAGVYADGLADYQAGMLAAIGRTAGAQEGVRALVTHHLRWIRANPALARFLFAGRDASVRLAGQSRVTELNRHAFAELMAWHRGHVRAGAMREAGFDLLYAIALGPAQEFSRVWLAGDTTTSIRRAERELADAAWAALAAKGAP